MWSQQIGQTRSSDTTIIMRGVHRQHSVGMFTSLLQQTCSKSPELATFNFVYLPCAREDDNVNLGLAFVNFATPASCKAFLAVLKSENAGQFYVRYAGRASLQGRSLNLLHLLKTRGHEGLIGPGAPRVYRNSQRVSLSEIMLNELPRVELQHVPWEKIMEDELKANRTKVVRNEAHVPETSCPSLPVAAGKMQAELLHGAIDPKIIAHRLAMLQANQLEASKYDPKVVLARLACLEASRTLSTVFPAQEQLTPYLCSPVVRAPWLPTMLDVQRQTASPPLRPLVDPQPISMRSVFL